MRDLTQEERSRLAKKGLDPAAVSVRMWIDEEAARNIRRRIAAEERHHADEMAGLNKELRDLQGRCEHYAFDLDANPALAQCIACGKWLTICGDEVIA